jgi:FkbM family methyltransferase
VIYTIEAHGASYEIDAGEPDGEKFGASRPSLIGAALKTGQPYEAKLLEHLFARDLEGVAVDVGAHVGNHALWLAVVCGLEVYAFEADPDVQPILIRNVARNRADVTVYGALGAGAGYVRAAGRGVFEPTTAHAGAVSVTPLDLYELEDVSLLKIDVEGMEPAVLRGARETIERCRPMICAEHQDRRARLRNAAELEPLGYVQTLTFGATPMGIWEPTP